MSGNEFIPLTPELGITGSSYRLQMGRVNNYWSIRLVKGDSVLDSKVFNNVPKPDEVPLGTHLVAWVLSVLAIPNLNTYQIQKTVGFLRSSAVKRDEELKNAKVSAGKAESQNVILEKPPENVQIKRIEAKGQVQVDSSTNSAEMKEIAKLSPALAQSNAQVNTNSSNSNDSVGQMKSYGSRQLHEIPRGEDYGSTSKVGGISPSTRPSGSVSNDLNSMVDAVISSSVIQDLMERISRLEKKVQVLQSKQS